MEAPLPFCIDFLLFNLITGSSSQAQTCLTIYKTLRNDFVFFKTKRKHKTENELLPIPTYNPVEIEIGIIKEQKKKVIIIFFYNFENKGDETKET